MTSTGEKLRASYASCRRKARRAGSNFYLSFLLLPRQKRRAMDALYAFMRHTDNLADSREPLEARRKDLSRWRASLQAALARDLEAPSAGGSPIDPTEAGGPRPDHALLPALVDAVQRFAVMPPRDPAQRPFWEARQRGLGLHPDSFVRTPEFGEDAP